MCAEFLSKVFSDTNNKGGCIKGIYGNYKSNGNSNSSLQMVPERKVAVKKSVFQNLLKKPNGAFEDCIIRMNYRAN